MERSNIDVKRILAENKIKFIMEQLQIDVSDMEPLLQSFDYSDVYLNTITEREVNSVLLEIKSLFHMKAPKHAELDIEKKTWDTHANGLVKRRGAYGSAVERAARLKHTLIGALHAGQGVGSPQAHTLRTGIYSKHGTMATKVGEITTFDPTRGPHGHKGPILTTPKKKPV